MQDQRDQHLAYGNSRRARELVVARTETAAGERLPILVKICARIGA